MGGSGTSVGRCRSLLIWGTKEFGVDIDAGMGGKALGPCQERFGTKTPG